MKKYRAERRLWTFDAALVFPQRADKVRDGVSPIVHLGVFNGWKHEHEHEHEPEPEHEHSSLRSDR